MNGMSLTQKVDLYRQFDQARHDDLERFAINYEAMKQKVATLEADLDDERTNRRSWRQRAELAESSVGRNKFAVILIDGDGYHFNRSFHQNGESGPGAQAAHTLYTDIQNYLCTMKNELNGDIEVMAVVFFNKQVPARVLLEADVIQRSTQFDDFIWSFTSSRSLFQAVDCGPGKERVDSKIRDIYRFYVNNAQCKYIFLACCHDNGYVAELDKYRHDSLAAPKTILVKHGNTANQFYHLDLPFVSFSSTFDMQPFHSAARRLESSSAFVPSITRTTSVSSVSQSSETAPAPATTWSIVTAGVTRLPSSRSTVTSPTTFDASTPIFEPIRISQSATGDSKSGIPVNRLGQRIDRPLRQPVQIELDRFEARIAERKLCNTEHLTTSGCFAYNCKFDHTEIDAPMKNTLKYKARSIACTGGSKCRKLECFYGHQCPWGADQCTNSKCAFYRNSLHEIDDLEIVKFIPAVG